MKRVWSEEGKLERWLEVELAALDGWAELGVVPREAAAEARERAVPPTPERVAEIEERTHHDLAAFVDAVAGELGPNGRWFHYGLTSSDVVDTALALQVREAGTLLLEGLDGALAAVIARAEEHRDTVMVGRTHGVHAEPITFGVKLAGWAFELARDRSRLVAALERMRVGKLAGAVGTYGGGDPEMERIACERLGLVPEQAATQVVPRDRHAELLSTLALCAASLERHATEIRHLARTELREVQEPFGKGQKGSSAMPHKRNPVVAERICGLARVVRAAAAVGLENVALWHERDISHSSAERVVLPDAFLALDYMLDRFTWLVERARRRRRAHAREPRRVTRPRVQPARSARPRRARGSPATRRIASCRGTPWRRGTSSATSASWSPAIRRSAPVSTPRRWRPPSTSTTPSGTSTSSSNASAPSPRRSPNERRRPSMPEATHVASGKVREIFELEADRLLLVASDRISTFDVVLPTEIPDKGRVLTGLSGFWFARTREVVPNHLVALRSDGRSTEARRLEMLPIECVVRGYLAGSGWKDYLSTGEVCGHRLPEGLRESDRLPEPIFTPATKAQTGHDENISREQAAELVGTELLADAERISLDLYRFASTYAAERGILIADTKFELGLDPDGVLTLGDEALTPDSSRFWPADEYEPGRGQPSYDKQYVRDYCETLGWDKSPPGPELPDEVVAGTRSRYVEAFERLTGIAFDDYLGDPEVVLR